MFTRIDAALNSITMYRLVLYVLVALAVITTIFSFGNIVNNSPVALAISLAILIPICVLTNTICARLLHVHPNIESSYITALILFFIFPPVSGIEGVRSLIGAGVIAIASKYVMVMFRKHIFNPVAIAAVVMVLLGDYGASWWIGSTALMPFVAVAGFLIVRKIRRTHMFLSFAASAIVAITLVGALNNEPVGTLIVESLTSWPIIFFGSIMLTEPLTTPPTQKLRIFYGVLVGILFGSRFHIGPFFSTPEFALVVGNIFSYLVSPKYKIILHLQKKQELAPDIYEFKFTSPIQVRYAPGQYLEWTIVPDGADARGNRRYFTIASSPTERNIRLTMKIPSQSSSFKRIMNTMKPGDSLCASQLAGDFVMPADSARKLVFIAGGIGITPFRSMARFLIDSRETRDIVLLYAVPHPDEIIYRDIFDQAKRFGMETHYVITKRENTPDNWHGHTGYIDKQFLTETVADMKNRMFYLSGPNAMVDAYKSLLRSCGVSSDHIITDYFPGL